MKKIMMVMLAALLWLAPAWGAPAAETARQDKFNNKTILGVYNNSGELIPLNVRTNDSGEMVVDAGTNTFTVAGPQLEAIKDATQAIEGIGNTTLAEVQAQSLQLGVIEGNGTTLNVTASAIDAGVTAINTELDSQSLQLGVIEGNGTTINVTASAIDAGVTAINAELDAQSLQLGVIEGNGTTLNVTASAIDAGVTAVNSELDSQSLQLGVIEGNGTTLNVAAAAIDAGVTAINSELDGQSLQLGVIEGNGTTLNVTASAIDAGVTAINSELDSQSLQLGVIEGTGTTGTAHLGAIEIAVQAIEGAGNTIAARLQAPLTVVGGSSDGATGAGMVEMGGRDEAGNVQFFRVTSQGVQALGPPRASLGDNLLDAHSTSIRDSDGGAAYLLLRNSYFDGLSWDRVRGTAETGMWVDVKGGAVTVSSSALPAGAATNAGQTLIQNEAVTIKTNTGTIATKTTSLDDKAVTIDTGNISGSVSLSAPATIADASTNTIGARFVYNPNNKTKTGAYAAQQTDTAVWTPVADQKIVLMGVYITSDTVLTIQIEDNDVDVVPPSYIAAKGGVVITAGPAPIWIGDDNDTLDVTSSGAGTFSVMCWGYEIE